MLSSLAKALFGSIIGGITKLVNRWRQDSAQQELGGKQVKEEIQDGTIEKLKKYRDIDNEPRDTAAAYAGLRKPKADGDDK